MTQIRLAAASLILVLAYSCSTTIECPAGSSTSEGLCRIDDPSHVADFVLPQSPDMHFNDPADTTAEILPDVPNDGTAPELTGFDAVATPTDAQMKELPYEESNSD